MHNPAHLDEVAANAKKLHNRISSARLHIKYKTKSEILLAELVFFNCLVTTLLLKQAGLDLSLTTYWPELSNNSGDDADKIVKSDQCYIQDSKDLYPEFKTEKPSKLDDGNRIEE
ncbi:hypothetical protein MMC22_003552 [Lobaria immixta]|nr:hypothetical protein [Lobaria immixta]